MRVAALALLLVSCAPVHADTFVEYGVFAKHWITDDSKPSTNLDNRVVGVSIDGWQVAGYNNTMGDDTLIVARSWEQYRDTGLSYGVSAGGIYGYSFAYAYGWMVYAAPHVRLMYRGRGITCRQMHEVSACTATFRVGG